MSKKAAVWLIIASSLVLIGGAIFTGAMTALEWDFAKLSTVAYETNEHEIVEEYQNIAIATDTADILLVPSEGNKTSVVCREPENRKHSVSVKDGTLVIEVLDFREWYDYIAIGFENPTVTVSIPQGEYGVLSVGSDTGDVEIAKDFQFKSMEISGSTGDVINRASVSGLLKIHTGTGDVTLEDLSAGILNLSVSTGKITASKVDCQGDFAIKVSTGKTFLTDITCQNLASQGNTGSIFLKNLVAFGKMSIQRSTGDVKLEHSDADEIMVKTDTGDVTGSLLTSKVFITETDTGRVSVPKTTTGGRCEITTDTGDIYLEIV